MRTTPIILGQLLIFLCAASGTGLIRRFALRTGLLDRPTPRSSHVQPTPRSGGVAVVVSFLLAIGYVAFDGILALRPTIALAIGCLGVAAIGFVDDRRSLPAIVRFCVHVLAAGLAVLVIGAGHIEIATGWGEAGSVLFSTLVLIALVWSINLFNFMDGIDGIASVQGMFVAGAGAWICGTVFDAWGVSIAFACLCSATAGFIIWNWPPAKIFLGDVGSGFLGFALGGLGLLASESAGVPIAVWLILHNVFIVDATITLLRRILRGERWLQPHRLHAYQHLSRRWNAHLPVTLSIAAVNLIWLLPWAWYAATHPNVGFECAIAASFPIVVLAFMCGAGTRET